MRKYIFAIIITIIYFTCVFGMLMFPFMDSHPLNGWMSVIICLLTLSIQVSLIVVYFNHKKR